MALTVIEHGDEIRDRRVTAGLSQQRLAELAGCSISTVRLIEKGWKPSGEMLAKLCAALNDVREATNLPHAKIGLDGPTNGT